DEWTGLAHPGVPVSAGVTRDTGRVRDATTARSRMGTGPSGSTAGRCGSGGLGGELREPHLGFAPGGGLAVLGDHPLVDAAGRVGLVVGPGRPAGVEEQDRLEVIDRGEVGRLLVG